MKFPERAKSCELQIAAVEAESGVNALPLAPLLEELAYCRHALGDLETARKLYERALGIYIQGGMHGTESVLNSIHSLGLLHRLQNNFSMAHLYYKHAADLSTHLFGETDRRTCRRHNYLAGLHYASEDYQEVVRIVSRSRTIYEQQLGADDASVVLCALAQALASFQNGQPKEGEAFLKEATTLNHDAQDKRFLKAHSEGTRLPAPDRSEALSADLLEFVMEQLRKRNYNDAAALFRHILVAETRELWPSHPLVAKNMKRAGDLHRTFGQIEKAVEIYQAALDLYMSSLGEADEDIAQLAEALGAASLEVNDVERARTALRLALDMREIFLSKDSPAYQKTREIFERISARSSQC
ncbi:MAG: tetratricopeptide repeat protein [Candidatus Obscuribacterales bacterium]